MAEKIIIEIDPSKPLDALKKLSEESKNLSQVMDKSLGNDASKSYEKLSAASENGTTKIVAHIENAATRIKEGLKAAFDFTSIVEGVNTIQGINKGIKDVLDLGKAFDRLNTRLELSHKHLAEFKKELGRKVTGAGQDVEAILPGVEVAAAKGNVKNTQELASIGETLAKAKVITGEDTTKLSETVIQILKDQGERITAASFKKTMDALQATRARGTFRTAEEAGAAILDIGKQAKKFGMTTREAGGLEATASQAGSAGINILQQLMSKAGNVAGQQEMNARLGRNVFQNGKLVPSEIGKINLNQYGKQSAAIQEQVTGLTGGGGEDFRRFVEAFRTDLDKFKDVTKGSDETATQFGEATKNLGFEIDKIKAKAEQTGSEVGNALSDLGEDLIHGNIGAVEDDMKKTGTAIKDNWKELAGALGGTALVGGILKGSIGRIFGKIGGGGGGLGSLLGGAGEAASLAKDIGIGKTLAHAGITPVFVVNAKEIGNASSNTIANAVPDLITGALPGVATAGGIAAGAGTAAGGAGAVAGVPFLAIVGAAVASALGGAAIGDYIDKKFPNTISKPGEWLAEAEEKLMPSNPLQNMSVEQFRQMKQGLGTMNNKHEQAVTPGQTAPGGEINPETIKAAVMQGAHEGIVKGTKEAKKDQKVTLTNPSAVTGRGGHR